MNDEDREWAAGEEHQELPIADEERTDEDDGADELVPPYRGEYLTSDLVSPKQHE